MQIFSTHRRKLEPKRRFGGRDFRDKIKSAANFKRTFDPNPRTWLNKILSKVGLGSKFWRGIAVIILIVIVYYLFISSKFVVANVSVSGNVQVSAQLIQDVIAQAGQSRLFLIKKNSFFLMTPGRIDQLLTTAIPTIKQATSQRIWPNRLNIEITERVPGFVIQSNGKYFLVDDEGTVVSQIDDPKNMLVVVDQLTEDFASGEVLPNSKLAAFVLSMSRQWNGKIATGIAQVKFTGKQSTDVQFVSSEGWSVMFDTTRSVVTQLDALSILLNKQIAAKDRPRLAYIDLRLAKWAYYCFQATPCSQQEQPDAAGTATTNASQ
ncbi:MAG: FtsQ-type POTRA domain-containing protein [Candidatus Doudnabacteria bacterium]